MHMQRVILFYHLKHGYSPLALAIAALSLKFIASPTTYDDIFRFVLATLISRFDMIESSRVCG